MKIGITERGDAGLNLSWQHKLSSVSGAILITKNPTDEFIELIKKHKDKLIVHVTITGHGNTIYEPNVPSPEIVLTQFFKLLNILGPEKTVLRIDPIIPTRDGLTKAITIAQKAPPNSRIRISFIDNYPHVKKRFTAAGITQLPFNFHAPLSLRQKIADAIPNAEICGEPNMKCTGCISERDLKALHLSVPPDISTSPQRKNCHCLAIKTELLNDRNQCPHNCIYCYWQ